MPTVGTPSGTPRADLFPQLCWSAWVLPVISEVCVSVTECARSTKVAIHSRVLWTQIYCQNSKFQSLWGTWHLNKETKCLSLDNSTCCIHIHHFGCTWEGRKTCPDMKCQAQLDTKLQRVFLRDEGSAICRKPTWEEKRAVCFLTANLQHLLELFPSDFHCVCWPLSNIQKLACWTVVIRKY